MTEAEKKKIKEKLLKRRRIEQLISVDRPRVFFGGVELKEFEADFDIGVSSSDEDDQC